MKVIVPIDNTPATQSLFDVLMGIHWYEGTEINLITVVPRWASTADGQASVPAMLREIESLAVDLRNALRICEVKFFIREGDPKIEITSFARQVGAHMILTAAGPLLPPAVEDVADSIISHAHCPVFVARPNYSSFADAQTGYRTVLVPVDDSVYADVALQWLLNFRWAPQTRFVLCSVIEHESAYEVAQESLLKRARILATVISPNVSMEVRTGDPTDGITSLAHKYQADLIVIGSHGRVGIKKLIFGSVSEELARKGPCSIAIVRGIAEPDDNWHRTGVFRRPKFEDIAKKYGYRQRGYEGGGDSPHILPGGMH